MFRPLVFVYFLLPLLSLAQEENAYHMLRSQMVEQQIKNRGISNPEVIQALSTVPRHKFVLPEFVHLAYTDSPLLLTDGQTISQPYIVGYMTEILKLEKSHKVLEIGTGSGYQAAILAQICDSVFSIEIFETLRNKAKKIFEELGYTNIFTKIGDGYKGWLEHAPYDAIIVTCSPTHIPHELKKQLAEGGKMVIPVGENNFQHLYFLQKRNGKIRGKNVMPVRFVPMLDTDGKKY